MRSIETHFLSYKPSLRGVKPRRLSCILRPVHSDCGLPWEFAASGVSSFCGAIRRSYGIAGIAVLKAKRLFDTAFTPIIRDWGKGRRYFGAISPHLATEAL